MRLGGKVALVTGASRGIGFAVAELFAREGAIVYAGSSSNPSGIFPSGVTGVELDVAKEEHWKRVVKDIVAAHGKLDVLVNNAGIAVYDAVHECSTENWRRVLGVNQDGCFFFVVSWSSDEEAREFLRPKRGARARCCRNLRN